MKKYLLFTNVIALCAVAFTLYSCNEDDEGNTPVKPEIVIPLEKEGYQVVLNEEFEGKSIANLGLNTSHWLLGQNGWDASLLSVDDGILTINAAITEEISFSGKNFYYEDVTKSLDKISGIIHSKDIYANAAGYLEVKVKFPADGDRLYPFIYIIDDSWEDPANGYAAFYHGGPYSYSPVITSTASFYPNRTTSAKSLSLSNDDIDTMNEFNVLGIEWNESGTISYYLNGEQVDDSNVEWINEDSKIYFMIGMLMDKEAEMPTRGIQVDYIRWYKRID